MITIGLDESGTFEGTGSAIKFIGGVIYTGDDYEAEKERLERLFRSFCERNGMHFPSDLHAIDMNHSASLKARKSRLKQELLQHMKQNGRYRLTCMLKSRLKRTDFVNISNLVHDDTASNLYEHMITHTLQNIIFYSPPFDREAELVLEIATRSIPVSKSNAEAIRKYEELGYSCRERPHENIYYLTDQKTFKTALAVKMMESRIQRPIQVDLNVQRINYTVPNAPPTPFLYAADLACDMIRDYLDPRQPDFNIMGAADAMRTGTGGEPLFWAYDDTDGIYKRFYLACSEKRYIDALSAKYELERHESPFRSLYERHCRPLLQTALRAAFDPRKLDIYEREVSYLLSSHVRADGIRSNTDLGLYIGEHLWEQISRAASEGPFGRTEQSGQSGRAGQSGQSGQSGRSRLPAPSQQYKLADTLMRGFNHKGNSGRAREFYTYCQDNRSAVSPEDYCGTALTAAQICSNELNFGEAIRIVEMSYDSLKKLKALYAEIAAANGQAAEAGRYPLYGKVLSSLGQFYAFRRERDIAGLFFEEALREFEPGSATYRMTVSFLLHLALDHGDRELYERYAAGYFEDEAAEVSVVRDGGSGDGGRGTSDSGRDIHSVDGTSVLVRRFDRIVARQDRYQLFVWAKALHVWPADADAYTHAADGSGVRIAEVVAARIAALLEDRAALTRLSAHLHPWQLICKYFALFMRRHGREDLFRTYRSRMDGIRGSGGTAGTIELINACSHVALEDLDGARETAEAIGKLRQLVGRMPAVQPAFADMRWDAEASDVRRQLADTFTFMYS